MLDTVLSTRKKLVLAMLLISGFVFLVTALVLVFYLYSEGQTVPWFLEPFLKYHIEFMVVMGIVGVLSGLTMYHLSNQSLQKQEQKVKSSTELIMRFLEPKEREIIELLQEKEGMTTQSEIARLPGMSRLKAHRMVKRLEEKGIITVHAHGKVNMVRLAKELTTG